MIKVSVVVPTFKTSVAGLARLIGSLDKQSMPAEEFEVIFVDDGSPDDTLTRVQELAETRANVRVEGIENSGWPSKPRNVGIDLARGEYVAFMDHDDELYPDALRAAYDFAVQNRADVVNGKESRTTSTSWAMSTYDVDRGQSKGRTDIHPLLPMNPHKLYRRAFLIEHDIRFREGARVLWEDIFFNLQVTRHAKVVSTLSSVPYYHWVTTKGSGSTTFIKSGQDFWRWLPRVCQAIIDELPGEEHRLQREQLELHQLNNRVVGIFDVKYTQRSEHDRRFMFEQARTVQRDFDLARLEDRLTASRRIRSELLRAGRQDLIEEVCIADAVVPGWGQATAAHWRDGVLHMTVAVQWADTKGNRPPLVRDADRIRKNLSSQVATVVSKAATDVTDEVAGISVEGLVRSRRSSVVWTVPSTFSLQVDDLEDGTVLISATADIVLDPASAAFGRPLDRSTYWDLHLLTRFGNGSNDRAVKSTIPASVSMTDGHLHLVYPNDGGSATVIPDGQVEAVRRLVPTAASFEAGGLMLTLADRHDGSGSVATVVGVCAPGAASFQDREAELRLDGGEARLWIPGLSQGAVEVRVGDRARGGTGAWIVQADGGNAVLEQSARPSPVAVKAAPAPVTPAKPKASLRRTAGRVLRRLGLR